MEVIAKEAALLSLVEIGLGSLLHAFSIPLGGHFLSLNQVFLLTRAVRKYPEESRLLPFHISSTAALLKSLSPAGKKLTPMLAIAAQGFLYSIGTFLFGPSLLGVMVGAALSSVWSIAQPLLLSYLLFGQTIVQVAQFYIIEIQKYLAIEPQHLAWILVSLIVFKAILAVVAAGLAEWLPEKKIQQMEKSVISLSSYNGTWKEKPEGFWENIKVSFKELMSPWFLFSFFFTAVFFFFSESDHSKMIKGLLQPVAVGFIAIFCFRLLPWRAIASVRATMEILRRQQQ